MKPFMHLKSVKDIQDMIFGFPMLGSEDTPLQLAVGRRIAETFYAPGALPGFRRSTMDGYAVRARDVFGCGEGNPALLEIGPPCRMGEMPGFRLGPSMAAPILTGAPLPQGADAVVMIEHTRETGAGQIEITRPLAPGANIVEADEDAAPGQALIPAGKRLRAQEIGILAAFGVQSIATVKAARVAIISTGDEIAPIDAPLQPGQLRDVNSWSLEAECRLSGAQPRTLGIAPDDPEILRKMLAEATPDSDIALVSGGSSAGMRDHTIDAFLSLPDSRILVHGAAISPGKPFILGQSGKSILLGMPGHVSSALICAHVFLRPLIEHLQGLVSPDPAPWFEARLARSVASAQGRQDYIRCRLERRGDEFIAIPVMVPSAILSGLLEADGLVICPQDSEGLAKDQKVRVYPI